MSSPNISTMTSFSGADLVVSFANQVVGELQQISWAIEREKAPVFTLGSADARSFSRGKRGIAGSLVFAVFNEDSLVSALKRVWDKISPAAMFTAAGNISVNNTENFLNAVDMLRWNITAEEAIKSSYGSSDYGYVGKTEVEANAVKASNNKPTIINNEITTWTDSDTQIRVPAGFSPIRGQNVLYADTLPPFDVTLTFGNEYGQCAFQKIYDVDILNESSGASVDTTVMSRQLTYIARRISPLVKGVYSRDENGSVSGQSVQVS